MLHLGSNLHRTNYFRLAVSQVLCHFMVYHFETPAASLPECKSTHVISPSGNKVDFIYHLDMILAIVSLRLTTN